MDSSAKVLAARGARPDAPPDARTDTRPDARGQVLLGQVLGQAAQVTQMLGTARCSGPHCGFEKDKDGWLVVCGSVWPFDFSEISIRTLFLTNLLLVDMEKSLYKIQKKV